MSLSTLNHSVADEVAWTLKIVMDQEKESASRRVASFNGPSNGAPTSPCFSTTTDDEADMVFRPGSPSNICELSEERKTEIAFSHWNEDVPFVAEHVQDITLASGKKSKLYCFTQVKRRATPPPPPVLDLGLPADMANLSMSTAKEELLKAAENQRKARITARKIKDRQRASSIKTMLSDDDLKIMEKQRLHTGKRVYAHPQVHARKRARAQVAECLRNREAYISV